MNNLTLMLLQNTNNNKFDGKLALIIALLCFLIPIIVLSIIVVIKKIIKIFRKTKSSKPKTSLSKDKFLSLFGKDNILNLDVVMTRVIVEVNDLDLVNIEELKKLNIGVLISGNVIKCSSEDYAELFK